MTATATKRAPAPSARSTWMPQPLQALREDIDSLCNQALGEAEGWLSQRTFFPTLDVHETDDAIVVEVDLPGVRPTDFDVHVTEHVLTIRGERKFEEKSASHVAHQQERRRGVFSRSVTLPVPVREEMVTAEYRDGVLTVTLPKTSEARGRRVPVTTM